jgi:hypothetical protein
MLVYKALYKKMMDDLKDAGMWIDWAEQLMGEHEEVARFLLDSAKERLEESFPQTYEHFSHACKDGHGKGDICVDEMVYDHMMDWCHNMKRKIEHMESGRYHDHAS